MENNEEYEISWLGKIVTFILACFITVAVVSVVSYFLPAPKEPATEERIDELERTIRELLASSNCPACGQQKK